MALTREGVLAETILGNTHWMHLIWVIVFDIVFYPVANDGVTKY